MISMARSKTRAVRARANPRIGSGGGARRGSVEAVPDTAVLDIGVEITKPSVAAARAIDELRRLGVEDQDMQARSVQHPARLSVHRRWRDLTGYPVLHVLTEGRRPMPPAAESRIDRHASQHRQRHHHRYREWPVRPCADGKDV